MDKDEAREEREEKSSRINGKVEVKEKEKIREIKEELEERGKKKVEKRKYVGSFTLIAVDSHDR